MGRVTDRFSQLTGDFRPSILRTAVYAAVHRGSRVVVGRGVRIAGPGEIRCDSSGRLRVGLSYFGFMNGDERTLIRNRGTVVVHGTVSVATGNCWDVLPGGVVEVGDGTYFSPRGTLVVSTRVTIGARCAIGWDVQILDDDMHAYDNGSGVPGTRRAPVTLGDDVWVGSRALIYKGVQIADGCVVAGGSVVTRSLSGGRQPPHWQPRDRGRPAQPDLTRLIATLTDLKG